MSKSRFSVRTLTTLAMLTALEIILSRFLSINAWNIKIGFNFVPIVVAAILYGPIAAGIVAAMGDFLGAVLFPIGAYFPGFTLTAFLTGCVFGVFLHKKQGQPQALTADDNDTAPSVEIGGKHGKTAQGWPQTLAAVGINQWILSLFLNTLWISVLYGSPYWPTLVTRLPQCAILTVVQIIFIRTISKILTRYGKKAFILQD